MLDHIGLAVSDITLSRRFYTQALGPLGITELMEVGPDLTESKGTAVGFGKDGNPFFWIGDKERVGEGSHIAFIAPNRAAVDAFFHAAIEAGGTDNGPPGMRPHYGPDYYAAFVKDPDGINLEAVCRTTG